MSRRSTQSNIRKYYKETDRKLRSNTMAGSNETESSSSDANHSLMMQTLAKMEEGINIQIADLRKNMTEDYTDLKSSLTKTEENIGKVVTSFENLSSELKILSDSNRKLEIEQVKVSDRLTTVEKEQDATDAMCEDLRKNVEYHDEEIIAIRAELEGYKDLKEEVRVLKKENEDFKIYKEAAEQQHRKYNLWFYGINENDPQEHVWLTVKRFCIEVLDVNREIVEDIYIKNTHRVGDTKVKDRPIIVVFSNWDDRQRILKAAGKLYSFNLKNNTKFAVKTDLAPLARAKRTKFYGVSNRMKADTKLQVKVRDNEKGRVWLASRKDDSDTWKRVDEKDLKPEWLNPPTTTNK